jgi:hypothetical protein
MKRSQLVKLIKEELNIQDNGPEEAQFDTELMSTANGIAAAIGTELKNKKQQNEGQLDEAIIATVIAGVITGNALIGFISKMAAKLLK